MMCIKCIYLIQVLPPLNSNSSSATVTSYLQAIGIIHKYITFCLEFNVELNYVVTVKFQFLQTNIINSKNSTYLIACSLD